MSFSQGIDYRLTQDNFANLMFRFASLALFSSFVLLSFLGCSLRKESAFQGKNAQAGFPTRFQLAQGQDVGTVIDGNTFLANLRGVHPLLGNDVPIRIRGFSASPLPPAKDEDLPAAIAAWTRLRHVLENARELELRMLERGEDGFFLMADLYVEGKMLKLDP